MEVAGLSVSGNEEVGGDTINDLLATNDAFSEIVSEASKSLMVSVVGCCWHRMPRWHVGSFHPGTSGLLL